MKWFCILLLLPIIQSEMALARSHPQDHQEVHYKINLDFGGVMKDIDTEIAGERSSLSLVEDESSFNFELLAKVDYGISDPPPIPKRPSKKPVQYRIFSRPSFEPSP